MSDYHVHLHPHGPYTGEGPKPDEYPIEHIEAYFEAAKARGVHEVGFTEHFCRFLEGEKILGHWWESDRDDLSDFTKKDMEIERVLSLDLYVEAVLDMKARGLPVKLGIEVDYFPETAEASAEFLEPYPFDFMLGSTHWLGGWNVGHPDQAYEMEIRGERQAFEDYFEVETQLAASGLFDVLAHADVIKKFGTVLESPPLDLYDELASAAAKSGVAAEVSTAGLHKPIKEMYPSRALLERFFEHGVPITIASDAHAPLECGRDYDTAVRFARSVGYTERIEFSQRVRTMVPL